MTTIVFPGQGSQFPLMGEDFYNEFSVAKETLEIIENATEIKIKEILFGDKSNLLKITQYSQLAIFSTSMMIFKVLMRETNNKLSINYSLGHSLGEYSAICASESLSIDICSQLLKVRGELMQNAFEPNKSGMAAVIGINCQNLTSIIKDKNLEIEVANDNSESQVVISGIVDNLKKTESLLKENGAKKIIYLDVSAAFHSTIMKKAETELKSLLEETEFQNPKFPIISNYNAESSEKSSQILKNLSNQMSNKVRWYESVQFLEKTGEEIIIEIGPGRVLTGLIKKISNQFTVYNINNIKDLVNFCNDL